MTAIHREHTVGRDSHATLTCSRYIDIAAIYGQGTVALDCSAV